MATSPSNEMCMVTTLRPRGGGTGHIPILQELLGSLNQQGRDAIPSLYPICLSMYQSIYQPIYEMMNCMSINLFVYLFVLLSI